MILKPAQIQQLETAYSQLAEKAGGSFQDYTHFKAWQFKELTEFRPNTAISVDGLSVSALIAAYRLGLSFTVSLDQVEILLSDARGARERFGLLVMAFFKLEKRCFSHLLQREEPSNYDEIHRDACAGLEYFLALILEKRSDPSVFERWQASVAMKNVVALLDDAAFCAERPEAFVEALALAANGLPDIAPPFYDPARLLVSLDEFRSNKFEGVEKPIPELLSDGHQAADEPVVIVHCNKTYFEQYCRRYLVSCGKRSEHPIVHLHLVGFALDEAEIEALRAEANIRLNVSWEPFAGKQKYLNWYAAISRYVHLKYWLDKYGFVILSDIDGVSEVDRQAFEGIPENSFALHSPVYEGLDQITSLWKNYHAGRAVFRGPLHDSVQHLSDYVSWYFFQGIEKGWRLWHLDQVGLALLARTYPEQMVQKAPSIFEQLKL